VLNHQAQELPVSCLWTPKTCSSLRSEPPDYVCCVLQFPEDTKDCGAGALLIIILNSLAAVNFFLGVVGVIQVSRILAWQRSVKGQTPEQQLEAAKDSAVEAAKGVTEDIKSAVSK
jgi:hypothetical protein